MDNGESKSRLHIDSDWKTEAAQEKERLAREEQKPANAGGAAAPEAPEAPSFAELLNMLAMQAAIALGGYQGPGGERIPADPAAAKHNIDLLGVLEQKTKGNLSDTEAEFLNKVLFELQMNYVEELESSKRQGEKTEDGDRAQESGDTRDTEESPPEENKK